MPRQQLVQYEQGNLDSLCGIYSIVNAERMINRTSFQDSRELFNEILRYIEGNGSLAKILTEGMILKQLTSILCDVIGDRIPYKKLHFYGVVNPDLKTFWTAVESFLFNNIRRVVLLCIAGRHDHWTVVKQISKDRIDLFDSDRLCHLNRSNCTTCVERGKRHHVIYPAQAYFLCGT